MIGSGTVRGRVNHATAVAVEDVVPDEKFKKLGLAFTGGTDPLHDEVRGRGWYLSLGERDPEAAAIAAPIFGRGRHFLGALGVIGPRSRFEAESHDRLAALVTEEAALLSRGLGG